MKFLRHSVLYLEAILVLTALTIRSTFRAITEPDPSNVDFSEVEVTKDIPYLKAADTPKLDLYGPKKLNSGELYPGVVIVHGGGWAEGSKGKVREQNFATTLVRAGYICASIDYSLATREHRTWPQVLYECKSSVQFLRHNA